MKGYLETLGALQAMGFSLGVITNGSSAMQNAKIEALRLRPMMQAILVSEEVRLEKPDRRIFDMALKGLGADPAQAWFIGDHPANHVHGAREAGLRAVWMKRTLAWPAGMPPPSFQVDSLADALAITQGAQA